MSLVSLFLHYGKDVKILPLSTSIYVEPTARQNFNVVSYLKGWLHAGTPCRDSSVKVHYAIQ